MSSFTSSVSPRGSVAGETALAFAFALPPSRSPSFLLAFKVACLYILPAMYSIPRPSSEGQQSIHSFPQFSFCVILFSLADWRRIELVCCRSPFVSPYRIASYYLVFSYFPRSCRTLASLRRPGGLARYAPPFMSSSRRSPRFRDLLDLNASPCPSSSQVQLCSFHSPILTRSPSLGNASPASDLRSRC